MRYASAKLDISIHALREEGDDWYCARPDRQAISIHALREEGDICSLGYDQLAQIFLSTPSARRATPAHLLGLSAPVHFYPRPPRGGRLSSVIPSACPGTFLSTPSARRATRFTIQTSFLVANISIHALREEGDSIGRLPHRHNRNFYPRPPRGGRHGDSTAHPAFLVFLSTPSARRATRKSWKSISAPCNFYPRPPQGGRRIQ